ncbi:hypothetical protein KBC59_03070 [Patescibacteria group bacterium]|nr:hypothetical protein [Patescibacteria group bacterium]
MSLRFRLLSVVLLVGAVWSVGIPAHAERSNVQCISDASLSACTSDSQLLKDCPSLCAGYCLTLSTDDVAGNPVLCGQCTLMSQSLTNIATGSTLSSGVSAVVAATCVSTAAKEAISAIEEVTCSEGPRGCCIDTVRAAQGDDGPIQKEDCKEDGGVVYYADCFCEKEGVSKKMKDGVSLNACTEICTEEGMTIVQTKGIGAAGRISGSQGGPSQAQMQYVNAMCFTKEECAAPEYGGSPDAWVAAPECAAGKGKCRAPEPVLELSSPILGQTKVQGFRSYVELGFRFLLSIVVFAAAVAFIWGGFRYVIGSASGDISAAKSTMTNAVIGLVLTFGAITILNTINPATTRYDKLDVFMINKSEFSRNDYCNDYKANQGKVVMYADAGNPPGSVLYDVAVFDKGVEKTKCGSEYYVQGFGGKTCKGTTCDAKTDVCLQCKSGIPECFGNPQGSVCVPVAIAGEIKYANKVRPESVYLVPFCNFMQTSDDPEGEKFFGHIGLLGGQSAYSLDISDSGADTISFRKVQDASVYQNMVSRCTSHGGLRGATLGVIYKDTTAIIGGNSDSLIIGKRDCGGNAAKYSGYNDGGFTIGGVDLFGAMFCGMQTNPSDYFENSAVFFTPEELNAAFSGSGSAISCNALLTPQNAPADPLKKFHPNCKYDPQ